MKVNNINKIILLMSLACPFILQQAMAAHDHEAMESGDHHHHHSSAAPSQKPINPTIPDPVLVDQDGKQHHFYSDLLKGKLVLMNSIYTSCQGTCPIQTAIFSQTRKMLGDRIGQDVQMISVSLDPVTDTPERLKEFASKHGVTDNNGWLFLTGTKQNVTEVLQAMDLYSADPEDHTPIAAVGNEPAGIWMKVVNLNSPIELVRRIDYVKTLGEERVSKNQ